MTHDVLSRILGSNRAHSVDLEIFEQRLKWLNISRIIRVNQVEDRAALVILQQRIRMGLCQQLNQYFGFVGQHGKMKSRVAFIVGLQIHIRSIFNQI